MVIIESFFKQSYFNLLVEGSTKTTGLSAHFFGYGYPDLFLTVPFNVEVSIVALLGENKSVTKSKIDRYQCKEEILPEAVLEK